MVWRDGLKPIVQRGVDQQLKNLRSRSGQLHDQFPIQRAGDLFQCRKREICRLAFVTTHRAARRPDFFGKRFLGETGAFTGRGKKLPQLPPASLLPTDSMGFLHDFQFTNSSHIGHTASRKMQQNTGRLPLSSNAKRRNRTLVVQRCPLRRSRGRISESCKI